MKIEDFKRMKSVGERKVQGESNLRDMSEVNVQQLEDGRVRYELDERNRRFRTIRDGELGIWESLE